MTPSGVSGEVNRRLADPAAALARVRDRYAAAARREDGIDGLGLEFDDWRFNLRSSNTEPLLRLNVEEEIDNYQARHEKLIELIKQHAEFDEKSSGH